MLNLATEQGFAYWQAWGMIEWGWALAEQGQGEDGIAQMGDVPIQLMPPQFRLRG